MHPSEDELVRVIYGEADAHVERCGECQLRIAKLQAARTRAEAEYRPDEEVSFEFLADQRRKIYRRIESGRQSWDVRRWAPAAAAALVLLAGGVALVEQHSRSDDRAQVSDSQLAQDVSQFASDPEPKPAAPLQALFEE